MDSDTTFNWMCCVIGDEWFRQLGAIMTLTFIVFIWSLFVRAMDGVCEIENSYMSLGKSKCKIKARAWVSLCEWGCANGSYEQVNFESLIKTTVSILDILNNVLPRLMQIILEWCFTLVMLSIGCCFQL